MNFKNYFIKKMKFSPVIKAILESIRKLNQVPSFSFNSTSISIIRLNNCKY